MLGVQRTPGRSVSGETWGDAVDRLILLTLLVL